MKSTFLLNIILLIFLNLIVKPIYIFGIDLKVQNVLGEEAFGSYASILGLVFIFSIVNDLGINVYNTRTISQDTNLVRSHFKSLLSLKLVLGLLFLGLLSIVFYWLSYDISSYYILILVAIVFILTSYFMFMRSNFSGLGLYKTDSLISVTDRLILIFIMLYLLYFRAIEDFKIEYFLYAQIVSLIVAISIARILLWKSIKGYSLKFSLSFSKAYLIKSMPYALVFLLMTIYSRMDVVMLDRMLSDNSKETGIYAAGYRLFEAGSMFAYLFAVLLLPMYARLLKNKLELQSLSEMAYKMIWIYVSIVALVFFYYNEEIARLLYVNGNAYYGSIFSLLMISLMGIAVAYIYGTMIVAEGSMGKMNWIFVFCIGLNFVLNYILIPPYQAYGAAIATVITQFVAMIGQIVVSHRILSLDYNYRMYLQSIIFGMICAIIFYGINQMIGDWMISMGINIILSLIIAFIMKMIDINLLTNLLRSKINQ